MRTPLGPDETLRVARLLLDSDAELPTELALDAARAANRAGDPDLGAQLAGLAGAESEVAAGMLLAQAHSMRNRYEDAEAALAAVEPLAAGSADAHDYLRQRLALYQWGLRRPAGVAAVLEPGRDLVRGPGVAAVHLADRRHLPGAGGRARSPGA